MNNDENSKWISCAERQPTRNGRYLVACKGIQSAVIRWYGKGWSSLQPVTHWQPLPRTPKQIKGEKK